MLKSKYFCLTGLQQSFFPRVICILFFAQLFDLRKWLMRNPEHTRAPHCSTTPCGTWVHTILHCHACTRVKERQQVFMLTVLFACLLTCWTVMLPRWQNTHSDPLAVHSFSAVIYLSVLTTSDQTTFFSYWDYSTLTQSCIAMINNCQGLCFKLFMM